jgi:RNA polymerase sigma-70 factor (ECF subfamily)
MPEALDARTSPSLLARLRQAPTDQAAWGEFVDRYGRKIYGWCRHWGLQAADAEDVTQDVLLRLAEKVPSFSYDRAGCFRGWLKTLAHHAWYDFLQRRRRAGRGSGDSQVLDRLQSVAARDDLARRLEDAFDRERLEEAEARVRLRVSPRQWDAFRLLALEGSPGRVAAARLGMTVAAVFVARSKVQRLVRAELRRLEAADPAGPEGPP